MFLIFILAFCTVPWVVTSQAVFKSPNYPGEYPHNLMKQTTIKSVRNVVWKVHFNPADKFEVEPDEFGNCYDYIRIYDTINKGASMCAETRPVGASDYCGTTAPKEDYISTTNQISIEFCTDADITMAGYRLTAQEVPVPQTTTKTVAKTKGTAAPPPKTGGTAAPPAKTSGTAPPPAKTGTAGPPPAKTGTAGPPTKGSTARPNQPPATNPPTPSSCGMPPAKYPSQYIRNGEITEQRMTRIIGGTEARPHSYPFASALFVYEDLGDGRARVGGQFCGGSLVNKKWIVTAAHCIAGKRAAEVLVKLGAHVKGKANELNEATQKSYGVKTIISHPDYNSETITNDYALLELDEEVMFTDEISPICMPTASDNWKTDQEKVIIAGWGRFDDGDESNPFLKDTVMVTQLQSARLDKSVIITKSVTTNSNACQGDSGGPMIAFRNGRFILVGAASYVAAEEMADGTIKCYADERGYTAYAYLPEKLDWINSYINK